MFVYHIYIYICIYICIYVNVGIWMYGWNQQIHWLFLSKPQTLQAVLWNRWLMDVYSPIFVFPQNMVNSYGDKPWKFQPRSPILESMLRDFVKHDRLGFFTLVSQIPFASQFLADLCIVESQFWCPLLYFCRVWQRLAGTITDICDIRWNEGDNITSSSYLHHKWVWLKRTTYTYYQKSRAQNLL